MKPHRRLMQSLDDAARNRRVTAFNSWLRSKVGSVRRGYQNGDDAFRKSVRDRFILETGISI